MMVVPPEKMHADRKRRAAFPGATNELLRSLDIAIFTDLMTIETRSPHPKSYADFTHGEFARNNRKTLGARPDNGRGTACLPEAAPKGQRKRSVGSRLEPLGPAKVRKPETEPPLAWKGWGAKAN
jgi:hypothetical protein